MDTLVSMRDKAEEKERIEKQLSVSSFMICLSVRLRHLNVCPSSPSCSDEGQPCRRSRVDPGREEPERNCQEEIGRPLNQIVVKRLTSGFGRSRGFDCKRRVLGD
jgi:hypothetical protein